MMDKYKNLLEDAQKDLEALRDQKRDLLDQQELIKDELEKKDNQIRKMEETVASLARLCNVEIPKHLLRRFDTLADTIRDIVKSAQSPITAVEVRDILISKGIDTAKYSNLLATVHTTLKRLAQKPNEEILSIEVDDKTAYKVNPEYTPKLRKLMETSVQSPSPEPPMRRLTKKEG